MKLKYLTAALLVGLLLAPAVAQAKATRIVVEGVELPTPGFVPSGPDRVWVSGGVLHIRGLELHNDFVGTWDGEPCTLGVPFVVNQNLSLTTGDGTVFGTSWAYVSDGVTYDCAGLIGTFEGNIFAGKIDGDSPSGNAVTIKFVAHGTGDFEGMTLRGTAFIPDPSDPTIPHPVDIEIVHPPS